MREIGGIYKGYSVDAQKQKYFIVLHISEDLDMLVSITTSQRRSGSLNPVHGKNMAINGTFTHVFLAGRPVAEDEDGNTFAFPKDTTIVFDYGILQCSYNELVKKFNDVLYLGTLYKKEYRDLIYTMYTNKGTPKKYKTLLEKILEHS